MEVQGSTVVVDMDENTLDALLQEIADAAPVETQNNPTSPVFVEPIKTESEEIPTGTEIGTDDFITEEDMDNLEKEMFEVVESLEADRDNEKTEKERIQQEFTALQAQFSLEVENKNKEIEEIKQSLQEVEDVWAKVQGNPIVNKMVSDIAAGIEVNIPQIVKDKIQEDIDAMPNMDAPAPVSIAPTPMTLQDRLNAAPSSQY